LPLAFLNIQPVITLKMSSSGVLSRASPSTYRQKLRFGVGAPCGLAGKHFEQPL
jgi:hypothetical protein